MPRAIVLLVGPRLLVLLDQIAIARRSIARGNAGLHVPAHLESVDVEARRFLDNERRRQPELVEVGARAREAPSACGLVPCGRSISGRDTCRKLRGLPEASARASSVFTTSYSTAATAAAARGAGRSAAKGKIADMNLQL